MSPKASKMLVETIMPILAATIPRTVKPVAPEDPEELVQDATVAAAQMLDAAERNNRPLIPQSIAFYVIQRTRSGRRSYSAGRTDALAVATQLDGLSSVESLDRPFAGSDQDDDGALCLHDVLAGPGEDPSMEAGRRLDWERALKVCTPRQHAIIRAIAEGTEMVKVAARYRISAPRVTQERQQIGRRIREELGDDVLAVASADPAWQRDLRCIHERGLAHAERRKDNEA